VEEPVEAVVEGLEDVVVGPPGTGVVVEGIITSPTKPVHSSEVS